MKSTISLNQPSRKASSANTLSSWLASDNRFFSWVMKEDKITVSNRQALFILQALFSGSLLLCAMFISWVAALVLLCWFVLSVYQCKKGGIK